jgi:serine protease Do
MMKTLCLAASLATSLLGSQQVIPNNGQQGLTEDVLWNRVKSSVALIKSNAAPSGVGVLVDSRGWFLAHGAAMGGAIIAPGTVGSSVYSFQIIASDKETNLVLLQASGWQATTATPIQVSPAASQKGERILAVTLDGPVWAELGEKDRVGNMRPSQRYAPLNELRLESGKARAQGALAFNEKAELVGVLGAALAESLEQKTRGSGGGGGGVGGGATGNSEAFGPGELTVAYAFGPKLLDRVVKGFRSADHIVRHPSIGVFFKKSPDGGALIESVIPGGEAEKSGLMPGDVVIEADGTRINEAVGFATVLFNQSIGDKLKLRVRRNQEVLDFVVNVGTQPSSEQTASSSFQRTDLSPRNSLNSGRNAKSSEVPTGKF